MPGGFLAAGTWVVDRNITVDHWPGEDMLATVTEIVPAGGGPACNFACDLKRLDPAIPVETQGLIGAGEWGDFLLNVADAHGITHPNLHRTAEAQTQMTDAYLSAKTGRRTHILFPGTGALLCPDHIVPEDSDARFFHLGLPGIHPRMDAPWGDDSNGWVTCLRRARAAGMQTNLELVTAPDETIRRIVLPCLPHLDTLVVNDSEIGALASRITVTDGVTDIAAVEVAAREVLGKGAMEVVVVHFTAGAVAVTRDGALHHPSVRVPDDQRVGANGAGDAFAAGFFYGRYHDQPLSDCLAMAHATAAASLRAADTYSGVDGAKACLDRANRWGWREMG
ncbi:carbohydrate kinase family protein [Tropicibacter alexandrii]|uniref:carbohydrate kinase family protein n=1 Tax=Tropicibacter alexandrii TaxID=2267683 RepID=UPI000EF4D37E|nr:carbohydrate kinase family protein [Tropicibacter alexandrii]